MSLRQLFDVALILCDFPQFCIRFFITSSAFYRLAVSSLARPRLFLHASSFPSSFFRSISFRLPCSPPPPCSRALRLPRSVSLLARPSCFALPVLTAIKFPFTITPRPLPLQLVRVHLLLTPGSRDASRAALLALLQFLRVLPRWGGKIFGALLL